MKRVAVFLYGVVSYAAFFVTFLYAYGFMENLVVRKSMDSAASTPLVKALAIDFLLLAIFAIQHSVMARPWFKRVWTRVVPEPAERSTYVLLSSVALAALFYYWEPLGGTIWNIENAVGRGIMYAGFGFGFVLLLASSFQINHFDLFGLRQAWLYLIGEPYTPLSFRVPFLYKYVRHPLYIGWFMSFWFTPTMTVTHLFFAAGCTAYILMAIRWEEKDLADFHGAKYVQYRRNVPMVIPSSQPYRELAPREVIRKLA